MWRYVTRDCLCLSVVLSCCHCLLFHCSLSVVVVGVGVEVLVL